jgi:hypothetical protein
VYPLSSLKKYSINWLGAKSVQTNFNIINFFSLPAVERKKMYPLNTFKGKFFFIPNYPSKNFTKSSDLKVKSKDEKYIKIVYPGTPSHKNGIIELISAIKERINNKEINLTLIGEISPQFINEIKEHIKTIGIENNVFFKERMPYSEMNDYLTQFHIGWALYKPVDLSVATAGSSSNKIYEFLANGLPIIVFDNKHHHEYFDDCKAVFYSDLSIESIKQQIKNIDNNYNELSKIANEEFYKKYQFETKFDPVFKEIRFDIENSYI